MTAIIDLLAVLAASRGIIFSRRRRRQRFGTYPSRGDAKRRNEALRRLAEHREELAAMGVGSLSLFGSVARDEAGPDSDVDLLIETSEPRGLFGLAAIHLHLEEILGQRVDLVTEQSLVDRYRRRIVPDLVRAT